MITNLHNIKPAPILLGVNRKGRHIAFVNFNPRPANDANRQNGLNWETDGNRYVLDDYSVMCQDGAGIACQGFRR